MCITSSDVDDEDDIPFDIIKLKTNKKDITIKSSVKSTSSASSSSLSSSLKTANSQFVADLNKKLPVKPNKKKSLKQRKEKDFVKLPSVSSKKLNYKNSVVSPTEKNNISYVELSNFFNNNYIKNDKNNTIITSETQKKQINQCEKRINKKGRKTDSKKKLITKKEIKNNNNKLKRKYNESQSIIESENIESDKTIIPENKFKKYNTDDNNKNSVTYPISTSTLLQENTKEENNHKNSENIAPTPIRKFFKNTNSTDFIIKTTLIGGKCIFKAERITEESDSKSVKRKHDEIIIKPNIKKLKKPLSYKNQENTNNNNNNQNNFIHKNIIENKNNYKFPDINKLLEKKNSIPSSLLSPKKINILKNSIENKENSPINKQSLNDKNIKNQSPINNSNNNNNNTTIKTKQLLLNDIFFKLKQNSESNNTTESNNNNHHKVIPEIEHNSHKNTQEQKEKQNENGNGNNKTTVISKFININSLTPVTNINHNTNNIMSMYDRRIQDDNRPINGYASNNSSSNNVRGIHHHNEDTSTTHTGNSIMSNHYYQCPPPQPTMATLCNIGNTCYLNSVVYTLRFAPMFLHNLHHLVDDLSCIQQNIGKYHLKSSSLGRNISGLHMENTRSWSSKDLASLDNVSCDIPKSNQQIATEKLHELYQNLHRNEYTETTEPFHAGTFLHAIQDVSAIFEGNQQQDAHEFLMCVLDSIRETCQSLIKAIAECPEVITNGCISLPEKKESQTTVTIAKEKPLQRDTGSSAIIKTSFFSRKSKRKDAEMKNSKNNSNISNNSSSTSNNSNNRTQSPHKDNTLYQINRSDMNNASSESGGDILSGSKHSLKANLIPENELTNIKDSKERLSEKIKRLGLDFFTEDFEGITVSTTKCLSCETITEQKETMIDIAVPMTGYEHVDLGEKFIQDSCVTKEYFRGENKYRCEQCMGYTEAIRSISYEVLPRLLVIQLSRFSGVMEKINTYLPTPFTLQCFCSKCLGSSASSSSSSVSSSTENKNVHVYKLYSVITHVGATMSVGHYIAYTCSLDWANDYINCPKDRMRQAQILKQQQQQQQQQQSTNITGSNTNNILNGPEKNVRLMKKMIFGRNKASSSGDMSKTVKNINGLSSSKSIAVTTTNGTTDKQQNNSMNNINVTCPSINCCGLQIRNNYLLNNSNYNNVSGNLINSNSNNSTGYYMDLDDTHHSQTSVYNSNYNSNNTSSSGYGSQNTPQNSIGSNNRNRQQQQQNEPIWYMCDDDKIKAMSQREFEDMLSPNRKIMITPYLLFYARSDIQ